jgi:hypothetical protein
MIRCNTTSYFWLFYLIPCLGAVEGGGEIGVLAAASRRAEKLCFSESCSIMSRRLCRQDVPDLQNNSSLLFHRRYASSPADISDGKLETGAVRCMVRSARASRHIDPCICGDARSLSPARLFSASNERRSTTDKRHCRSAGYPISRTRWIPRIAPETSGRGARPKSSSFRLATSQRFA